MHLAASGTVVPINIIVNVIVIVDNAACTTPGSGSITVILGAAVVHDTVLHVGERKDTADSLYCHTACHVV